MKGGKYFIAFDLLHELHKYVYTGWPKCTDFYPGKYTVFHSFQQIFHENFKKKSRQNEVSLTYFLHSK